MGNHPSGQIEQGAHYWAIEASPTLGCSTKISRDICICYSTGRNYIRDIISRVVGIAEVKSHEAKPSVISPLYLKLVQYIPEFHDCPCYNILLIPWLQRGSYITFFTLVGDISRRQVIFHVGR